MTILAVGTPLNQLAQIIRAAEPHCELHVFEQMSEAIQAAREGSITPEAAFFTLQNESDLQQARMLGERFPRMQAVLISQSPEFAMQAYQMHARGYILQPVTPEKIRCELDHLPPVAALAQSGCLRVQTFGNFEVFYQGKPLYFERNKTKELFAYLVDRRGAASSTAQICAVLWENKEYSHSLQSYIQTLISDMMQSLRAIGMEHIILKRRNSIALDTTKLECDYYRFLQQDGDAVKSYVGEYMTNYSWAEMTNGSLQMSKESSAFGV